MTDLAELFPGLLDAPTPREGYASNPIGRCRQARPVRRRYRPPSATLALLAQLRRQLDDGLTGIGQTLKRIEGDFAGSVAILAGLGEAVDQMRRRMIALERHAGIRPAPELPRHSRKRPLQ